MTDCSTSRVLVVDDDSINLITLEHILKNQNYQVKTASNGLEALEAVQAELPDVILLDVVMPKMDGYSFCQQLKGVDATREIPVIFLSSLSSAEEKVKAFKVGGVDYIVKPFEPSEVIARVRTHLSLRRVQCQLEEKVRQRTSALEEKHEELRDANITLKYLLREIEREKDQVGQTMLMNIEKLVLPNLDRMVGAPLPQQEVLRKTLSRNLLDLVRPLVGGSLDVYRMLTPTELQLVNLIRQGKNNKETADELNISVQTVSTHRRNIRKKLNITGKNINLTTFVNQQGGKTL